MNGDTHVNGVSRYMAVVEVWSDGEKKTYSAGTYATKGEAEEAYWTMALKYADSPEDKKAAVSRMTLQNWSETWLKQIQSKKKANTVSTYRYRMEHWILPYLKKKKLSELTGPVLQVWLDDELGHLAYRSQKSALLTLSSCLRAAEARGLCKNPCKGVVIERTDAQKAAAEEEEAEASVWSFDEANQLLATGNPIVVLGIYGGLRRGEMLGLRWSDLNVLTGDLHVSRNVVQTSDLGVLWDERTKSGKSRDIKLPPDAVDALLRYKDSQEAAGVTGPRIIQGRPETLSAAFRRLCKSVGVEVKGPHSLRHQCASVLLSARVSPAAVAAHLGHASADITLRVYAHFLSQDEDVCASTLGAVFRPTMTTTDKVAAAAAEIVMGVGE